MIKEIIILCILGLVGIWISFLNKKDFGKEKYIFLGFIILLFTIIYSVSFLGYKIGGDVNIEKTKQEIYAAKKDVEGIAKNIIEVAYIISDGTGRYGGMPKAHIEEVDRIKNKLFKELSMPQSDVENFEKNIKEKIGKINERISK